MNCFRLVQLAQKQTFTAFNLTSVRYASQHPVRFVETQNMWKEKDRVSKRWQLIYKAPMDKALNFASTYLTVTTGILSAASVYYGAFVYEAADINKPIVIGDDVMIANSALEGLVYLGAFIALHVAVKVLLSKYVVRLYKDGDEYLAVYRGHMFNSVKTHKFHLKEFKKLNPALLSPWNDLRFGLGSKQGIILENYFKTPEHFNYLLYKHHKDDVEE